MKLYFKVIFLCVVLIVSACGKDSPAPDETLKDDKAVDTDRGVAVTDEYDQPFSLRMADDTEIESVSYDQMMEGLESLDSYNFFLVLSEGDDFIQTAVIEGGYLVEYKKDGNHYTSVEAVEEDEMKRFFSMYYNREDGWKDLFEWEDH